MRWGVVCKYMCVCVCVYMELKDVTRGCVGTGVGVQGYVGTLWDR